MPSNSLKAFQFSEIALGISGNKDTKKGKKKEKVKTNTHKIKNLVCKYFKTRVKLNVSGLKSLLIEETVAGQPSVTSLFDQNVSFEW